MFKEGDIVITRRAEYSSNGDIARKKKNLNVVGKLAFIRGTNDKEWAMYVYDFKAGMATEDFIAGVYWHENEFEKYNATPREKIRMELLRVI